MFVLLHGFASRSSKSTKTWVEPCYAIIGPTSGSFTRNTASLNPRSGGLASAADMKDENMNFNRQANR
jgi:hypothetical protein